MIFKWSWLTGFVQNKGVSSALKKYPGLYLLSLKKKIKNENLKMIFKWLLWISSLKVQALGSDAPGYSWNDQLLK